RARPRSSPDPPTRDDGDTSADAAAESTLRAARSEVPVLILGEPGSGRSQLAREIHAASRRRGRPLVEVEASLLTPELADAELFGVRRGAFTGADADRPGRVGRAAGGSLLFDHVEELHPRVQPKLLRLLAEQR